MGYDLFIDWCMSLWVKQLFKRFINLTLNEDPKAAMNKNHWLHQNENLFGLFVIWADNKPQWMNDSLVLIGWWPNLDLEHGLGYGLQGHKATKTWMLLISINACFWKVRPNLSVIISEPTTKSFRGNEELSIFYATKYSKKTE